MKRTLTCLLAVLAVAPVLSACSVKSDSGENDGDAAASSTKTAATSSAEARKVPPLDGKRIAVSAIGTDHHFDRTAFNAMRDRIEALGGEPVLVDAERDNQKAIAGLENLIAQKPDAIVQMLGDAKVLNPTLAKVRDADIPLFTVDFASPHSINNSTSDNYVIGSTLARTIAEDMGGKGRLLVFNGFKGVRVCNIRYNQLREVLEDYPDIQILQPELQDVIPNTVEDARKKTRNALARYGEGEIDAVWACWDIPMVGAATAIDQAGRKDVKVYGIDGDPTALDLLEDPESSFTADMAQRPAVLGRTSIDNVALYLAGREDAVPRTSYTEPLLVDKSNIAEHKGDLLGEDE